MELDKAPTIPFNIFINTRYHRVKVVGDEVTLQFSIVGIGETIKKFDVLFIKKEHKMLAQSMC